MLNVRRLAALDMALHGPRFIVIEFALGVGGCAIIGGLSLSAGLRALNRGVGWQLLLGVALLWIALNYVPLLLSAIDLARGGSARQEAAAELADPARIRQYGLRQLWILIPLAILIFALIQRGQRPPAADSSPQAPAAQ